MTGPMIVRHMFFDTMSDDSDKSIMDVFCKRKDFKKPVWKLQERIMYEFN